MNTARMLVSLLLCLTMPASALASVTQGEHCARLNTAETSPTLSDAHAGHDMQGMDHSQHMPDADADAAKAENSDKTSLGCACGCDCTSRHCFSSASGFLSGMSAAVALVAGDDQHPDATATRTASAHHLDLIRPPSLT